MHVCVTTERQPVVMFDPEEVGLQRGILSFFFFFASQPRQVAVSFEGVCCMCGTNFEFLNDL